MRDVIGLNLLVLLLVLIGTLIFSVIRLAIWISRQQVSWWVAPSISLGVVIVFAAYLAALPRAIDDMIGRVPGAVFNSGPLLFLTVLPLGILIGMGVRRLCSPTRKWILVTYLCGVLLCAGIVFIPARYFFGMVMFERMISSAVEGEDDPEVLGQVQWEAGRNREVTSWLHGLPPVSDVRCLSTMLPDGACCRVDYSDGRRSEVHIYRTDFRRYTVRKFTNPSHGMCRNPDFNPRAAPGSPSSKEFVRCDKV